MTVSDVCGRSYALVTMLFWTLALLLLLICHSSCYLLILIQILSLGSPQPCQGVRSLLSSIFGSHSVLGPSHAQGSM